MNKTGIEWTDATWNPIRGCSRVSEGCRNCYAERHAYRFSGERVDGRPAPYAGLVRRTADGMRLPQWNGQIKFVEEHLLDPLRWKTPRRIFVNSMSDLFHENVTDEMRDQIFAVMALCPQHMFQVLTKRPARMREYLKATHPHLVADDMSDLAAKLDSSRKALRNAGEPVRDDRGRIYEWDAVPPKWPLRNVWLGVSVENQKAADERIPLLLQTPAAVRFISAEPLLGLVDIFRFLAAQLTISSPPGVKPSPETVRCLQKTANATHREYIGNLLDWVIVGGESGPGARPMQIEWARSIVQQCAIAGVPCFVKQMGDKPRATSDSDDALFVPLMVRKGKDMDYWPEDLRIRQFPMAKISTEVRHG